MAKGARRLAKEAKREAKREKKRAAEEAQERARQAHRKQRLLYQRLALGLPVAAAVLGAAVYFATNDTRLAALTAGVGIAVWMPVVLGLIGMDVEPRDRDKAGAIDFGSGR